MKTNERIEKIEILKTSIKWAIKGLQADFASVEFMANNTDYSDFDIDCGLIPLVSTCDTLKKRVEELQTELEKESAYADFLNITK